MARLFRIRAQYRATSVVLLVRGDDVEHAKKRARWYQRGAESYGFLEELEPDDPRRAMTL